MEIINPLKNIHICTHICDIDIFIINLCIYVCVYIHTYVCVCEYIYIYIDLFHIFIFEIFYVKSRQLYFKNPGCYSVEGERNLEFLQVVSHFIQLSR